MPWVTENSGPQLAPSFAAPFAPQPSSVRQALSNSALVDNIEASNPVGPFTQRKSAITSALHGKSMTGLLKSTAPLAHAMQAFQLQIQHFFINALQG